MLIISDVKQRLSRTDLTKCWAIAKAKITETRKPEWLVGFPLRASPVELGKFQTGWRILIYKTGVLLFVCSWFFCGMRASHCCGLSRCGAQAPNAQARRPWLMWDLPGPGHKPVSPASAGGLSTTAPPGKPSSAVLMNHSHLARGLDLFDRRCLA